VKVADHVSFSLLPPQIAASTDTSGTVMYLVNGRLDTQMIWYDRSGTELGRAALTANQGNGVSLAPDGRRVAFLRFDDTQNFPWLWLQDLERNQETPLVRPPFSPGAAVWSPDGQRVVFRATGTGVDAMYVKGVNGGKEEILLKGTNPLSPSDWSRNGRWLVYTESNPKTLGDIWLLPDPSQPSADRKPVPLLRTPSDESQGQISPDGKWLAYYSDESGSPQIYLRPFAGASPTPDIKWRVSTGPSREPRWRADGRELFYLDTSGERLKMMSVPIGAAPSPAGTPKLLFEFQAGGTLPFLNHFVYSPSADGQRFLVNGFATGAQPSLDVILNWGKTEIGK
jgi:Tol biopolymer transport system component